MSDRNASSTASPCIGRCQLDAVGVCVGCYRTRAEIGRWLNASNEEKREIVSACAQRWAVAADERQAG